MTIIITVLLLALLFGLLVGLHELGHMLLAKLNGVWVQEFSFGFGPTLFSKKIGETNYKISLFPLGGYVKLFGESKTFYNEDIQRDFEKLDDEKEDKIKGAIRKNELNLILDEKELLEKIEGIEDLSEEEKNWVYLIEMNSKDRLENPRKYSNISNIGKLSILLGGVLMNFLLGVFIYSFYLLFFQDKILLPKEVEMNFWGSNASAVEAPVLNYEDTQYILIQANGLPMQSLSIVQELVALNFELDVDVLFYDLVNGSFKETVIKFDSDLIDKNFPDITYLEGVEISNILEDSATLDVLEVGDVVVELNEQKVDFTNFKDVLGENLSVPIVFKVKRDNEIFLTKEIELEEKQDNTSILGVYYRPYYPFVFASSYYVDYGGNFFGGFSHSLNLIRYQNKILLNRLGMVYKTRRIQPISESVGGPIMVGALVNSLVKANNYLDLLNFAGFISLTLAFMNILPLPLLDGGFVVVTLIEMVRKKPMSEKFMRYYSLIGLILFSLLTVLVFSNDIRNVFIKKLF
jgi:regulator of sigma E protease